MTGLFISVTLYYSNYIYIYYLLSNYSKGLLYSNLPSDIYIYYYYYTTVTIGPPEVDTRGAVKNKTFRPEPIVKTPVNVLKKYL